MSRYINIVKTNIENRKTPIYIIKNINNDFQLGVIKWWGAWRQYCFFPEGNTVFNVECLNDITDYIKDLNKKPKSG